MSNVKAVKAKFFCNQAAQRAETWNGNGEPHIENVELSVVQGKTDEDKVFQAASPGGELKLQVANKDVWGFFKPGKKYYVTFEEAPE